MISASVGVIGSGISGIACARVLARAGLRTRVFERQRAAGGRLATRRFEATAFDHGTQYITASAPEFRALIEAARRAGVVDRWQPNWAGRDRRDGDLWVGTPGMSNLPRWLAQDLDVEYGARIVRIERGRDGWILMDDRSAAYVDFDVVVLAMPAPAAGLLAAPHTALAERVLAVPMAPCWAVMVALEQPLEGVPDAAICADPLLAWFARDSSKPERGLPDAWVLHAGEDWSRYEFERPPARIQQALLERFSETIDRTLPPVVLSDAHRWRDARVQSAIGEPYLWDHAAGIGFCGDWCLDARVEAAWMSGHALGSAIAEARRTASSGKMRGSR